MRVATPLLASLVLASATAAAQEPDRFARSISVGASVGAGGPRGFVGAFVELRPWRALALGGGVGLGGAFGPSFDATAVLTPVGTGGWALGVSGSFSHQVMWTRSIAGLQLPAGRAVPGSSQWASLALVNEFRPSGNVMLRLSVGRAWMLNTSDFNVVRPEELPLLDAVRVDFPGATPVDAARAAANGDGLGVWFVQLDVAPAWHW